MTYNAILEVNFSEQQTVGEDASSASVVRFTATGGEFTFQKDELIDATPLLVFRDGISWQIIANNVSFGSGKECKVNTSTGVVTYNNGPTFPALQSGEVCEVLYIPAGGQGGELTEPITLQQMKDWMKVETDNDDTLITALIKAARATVEGYINKSVVLRTITAVVNNSLGDIALPYAPVGTVVSAYDVEDVDLIESGELITAGYKNIRISQPWLPYIKIIYTAGFSVCPEDIKTAIKEIVFYYYQNRGSAQGEQIPYTAQLILNQYRDVI